MLPEGALDVEPSWLKFFSTLQDFSSLASFVFFE
jgi:hypothetical protein